MKEPQNEPQLDSATCFLGGFLLPHPPVIIPAVGKGREQAASTTISGMRKAAETAAHLQPDTVVLISPHAPVFRDFVVFHQPEEDGKTLSGSLTQFGDDTRYAWQCDLALQNHIMNALDAAAIPCGVLTPALRSQHHIPPGLDHGTLVPLIYLQQACQPFQLVALASADIKPQLLMKMGRIIRESAEALGRRTLFIASGDLSHKANRESPYGYVSEGAEFDARLTKLLAAGDLNGILCMESLLRERAAECGYRSILTLCGALEGLTLYPQLLSYEAPFGIGYGVVSLLTVEPVGSAQVRLAKAVIDAYIQHGQRLVAQKAHAPASLFESKAGVFVTLHKEGKLRGCIGTIAPTTSSIADEIVQNAISAATTDPRFQPVTAEELPALDIHVDVLSPPEPVLDKAELDPKRYGVIVEKGYHRGLLLPDLEGVDSVAYQLEIACRKAGIDPDGDYHMSRFTVTRYEA